MSCFGGKETDMYVDNEGKINNASFKEKGIDYRQACAVDQLHQEIWNKSKATQMFVDNKAKTGNCI